MPTASYEVIGEHSAPDDFKNHIKNKLLDEAKVHIIAKRVHADDSAKRRGDANTTIEFDLIISDTHTDDGVVTIGGYISAENEGRKWILIEVTDRVRFDILD